jgi:hypothetical protein
MYRITGPDRSRRFYKALGFEFRRELPSVVYSHVVIARAPFQL